jgi:uncharacterized glyoxalase superfamily protein PhnB
MRIDAVGISSSNLKETAKFYSLLGFEFPKFKADEDHLEPVTAPGGTRLMIDSVSMMKSILGEPPKPGNHSSFAILYDTPAEVDAAAKKVEEAGYTVVTAPWDAFWGQRYAIVQDPDGYKVDLFAALG